MSSPTVNAPAIRSPQLSAPSSQTVNISIAAGTTVELPISGNQFYFVEATGEIFARPRGGNWTAYQKGLGLGPQPGVTFDLVQLWNQNSVATVVSIFIGFAEIIDNRVILDNASSQIVYPTYSTPGSLSTVLIPDLSGTAFNDINGNPWLAINRISIMITNFDAANPQALKGTTNNAAIIAVLPNTSGIFYISGNYRIAPGASINAYVSEVYNAIPPL